MTRKSEREIERAIGELGGGEPRTVRGWLRARVEGALQRGDFDVGLVDDDAHGEGVTVYVVREDGQEWRVPAEEVPAWIDVEEDLPIRGSRADCPFILADFTGTST